MTRHAERLTARLWYPWRATPSNWEGFSSALMVSHYLPSRAITRRPAHHADFQHPTHSLVFVRAPTLSRDKMEFAGRAVCNVCSAFGFGKVHDSQRIRLERGIWECIACLSARPQLLPQCWARIFCANCGCQFAALKPAFTRMREDVRQPTILCDTICSFDRLARSFA